MPLAKFQEGRDQEMNDSQKSWFKKAKTLTEALPYMRRYSGKTLVIKFGGNAMINKELSASFAQDIVLMKQVGMNPIVVHGGGPQIGEMLKRLKIESKFIDGLRVTDGQVMEVAEMVLSGTINKSIAASINKAGGEAIGLSGKDSNLVLAEPLKRTKIDPDSNVEKVIDLGFVGYPKKVNAQFLEMFKDSKVIPVIAPIAMDEKGDTYNINADTMAGAIAEKMKAERLLLLTDVAGVLDGSGKLIAEMNESKARAMIEDGTLTGGMIPKIETCLHATRHDVTASVIIDGRIEHALILELFTEHGVGTLIQK